MSKLVTYSPFKTLSLFDELSSWDSAFPFANSTTAIDISEDSKEYKVKADAPGYEKEEISIDINDGLLTIKGLKKKEESIDNKSYIRRERKFSSFEKSIILNEDVVFEDIKASLKNGVLELTLPKKEAKKIGAKKINVE